MIKSYINKFINWNPSKYASVLMLLLPLVLFIFKGFYFDNDFWFLINTGKLIVEKGFVTIEPFTIHSGLLFIPQQWLTDVIFYYIYNILGVYGMFGLVVICDLLYVFLLNKIFDLYDKKSKAKIFVALLINLFVLTGFMVTRPQLFDIFIFTLELYFLELYVKYGKWKHLLFIPILSLLFINLHASIWLLFFVFLLPYYVEFLINKLVKKNTYKIMPIFIVTIISFLLGFINPYGYSAIAYLFNSYGIFEINNTVSEMKPILISSFAGIIVYGLVLFGLWSFYYNKGKNKIRYFLLLIGTAFLGLSHFKGFLYFLICLPFVFGYNFKDVKSKISIRVLNYEKVVYCIIIMVFVIYVLFFTNVRENHDFAYFVEYLDNNATKDIKLYTNYDAGSYFEYGGYKCYIDPRAEVFLKANNGKEDIFKEYYKMGTGMLDIDYFLDKYNFDYLVIEKKNDYYLYNYLRKSNDYEQVYSRKFKDYNSGRKRYYYLFKKK